MLNFFIGAAFGFAACFIFVWVLRELSFGVFSDNDLEEVFETVKAMQDMGFGVEIYFNPANQWKAQGKLSVKVNGSGGQLYESVSKRGFWQNDLATAVSIAYRETMLGKKRKNCEINS